MVNKWNYSRVNTVAAWPTHKLGDYGWVHKRIDRLFDLRINTQSRRNKFPEREITLFKYLPNICFPQLSLKSMKPNETLLLFKFLISFEKFVIGSYYGQWNFENLVDNFYYLVSHDR